MAGTDPTDRQSILRVITVRRLEGGSTTVLWAAVPGRLYRVQFKESVEDPGWTTLPDPVRAQSGTGSYTDVSQGSQRFYRVTVE
jgi:hypothetical protein